MLAAFTVSAILWAIILLVIVGVFVAAGVYLARLWGFGGIAEKAIITLGVIAALLVLLYAFGFGPVRP